MEQFLEDEEPIVAHVRSIVTDIDGNMEELFIYYGEDVNANLRTSLEWYTPLFKIVTESH